MIRKKYSHDMATLMNCLRYAKNPFWDDSSFFKRAIYNLRKEGVPIKYDRKRGSYYNKNTVSPYWGY